MTGFGCCGSGAISGAAEAGVEPNSEANRLRFLGAGGGATVAGSVAVT